MHGNDRAPLHIPGMVSHPPRPPRWRQHARGIGSGDEARCSEHIRRDCGAGAGGGIDIQSVGHAGAGGGQDAKEIGHGVAEGQSQEEADGGWGEEYLGHLAVGHECESRVGLRNQGSSGSSL